MSNLMEKLKISMKTQKLRRQRLEMFMKNIIFGSFLMMQAEPRILLTEIPHLIDIHIDLFYMRAWLCACMSVCVHKCLRTWVHLYGRVCMSACLCGFLCAYLHAIMPMCMPTCIRACACAYACLCLNIVAIISLLNDILNFYIRQT